MTHICTFRPEKSTLQNRFTVYYVGVFLLWFENVWQTVCWPHVCDANEVCKVFVFDKTEPEMQLVAVERSTALYCT